MADSRSIVATQLKLAFCAVFVAVTAGFLGALHYVEPVSKVLNSAGIPLTALRSIHTTFAHFWIFGASIAVIYHHLGECGTFSRAEILRHRFHNALWLAAAVGIVVTLSLGITSGREYLEFHPALSAVLLTGWFAFAWTYFSRKWKGFWSQPVYVYMWAIGILYFVYTFVEGHAYLLPGVAQRPVVDLQIQWKSCGTMVGSFNFLMYGSLIYLSEKLTGNRDYAHSKLAFALFGVGALNSFTNYAHHTYHLPQSEFIKWIAFIVSMLEVLILLRVIQDVVKMVRLRSRRDSVGLFLDSSKWWTLGLLPVSILISVPPLNTFIHGTQVVMGHGMGAELGIDTMVLLGASAYLATQVIDRRASLPEPTKARRIFALNLCMLVLVGWLSVSGLVHGVYRYHGEPSPDWTVSARPLFMLSGLGVGVCLLAIVGPWLKRIHRPQPPPP